MSRVIMFLADGFEECEGLITVDLLRRAGIVVTTASVMEKKEIVSAHGIRLFADVMAEEADYDAADMLILPGGQPGTRNLAASSLVREKCLAFAGEKKLAAICAAPTVLAGLGLLRGKEATCYPTSEPLLEGAHLRHIKAVTDGNITTGQALGAAFSFALRIISELEGAEAARKVAEAICL